MLAPLIKAGQFLRDDEDVAQRAPSNRLTAVLPVADEELHVVVPDDDDNIITVASATLCQGVLQIVDDDFNVVITESDDDAQLRAPLVLTVALAVVDEELNVVLSDDDDGANTGAPSVKSTSLSIAEDDVLLVPLDDESAGAPVVGRTTLRLVPVQPDQDDEFPPPPPPPPTPQSRQVNTGPQEHVQDVETFLYLDREGNPKIGTEDEISEEHGYSRGRAATKLGHKRSFVTTAHVDAIVTTAPVSATVTDGENDE